MFQKDVLTALKSQDFLYKFWLELPQASTVVCACRKLWWRRDRRKELYITFIGVAFPASFCAVTKQILIWPGNINVL